MAEFVWLDVVPDGDSGALRDSVPDDFLRGIPGTFPIGPPFRFRVHVRKDWLDQRTTDASDGSGKWVTAVIPMVLLNDWQTQSPGALPFFTAFGVTFQVDVTLAQSSPTWRGRVNVYVSGTGRLISLPASSDPDAAKYQLRLTAGTVRVFTRDGFWAMRSQGGEFLVDNHGGAILDRWRKEVWPDPRYDVAAVTFGSNNLQIDIVAERDPANRRR
ncbi:MAG TPA: hypothetical protein VEL02_14735, partial [Jatrophihabitantaceae bacterium]|nr:hypothetical protein [Jatrophihabitantaceae bacterium]